MILMTIDHSWRGLYALPRGRPPTSTAVKQPPRLPIFRSATSVGRPRARRFVRACVSTACSTGCSSAHRSAPRVRRRFVTVGCFSRCAHLQISSRLQARPAAAWCVSCLAAQFRILLACAVAPPNLPRVLFFSYDMQLPRCARDHVFHAFCVWTLS